MRYRLTKHDSEEANFFFTMPLVYDRSIDGVEFGIMYGNEFV